MIGIWKEYEVAIMNTAKIFVVSHQDIFRAGVITITRSELALEVVGDSTNIVHGMRSIMSTAPDLIILDLHGCDLTQDYPNCFITIATSPLSR